MDHDRFAVVIFAILSYLPMTWALEPVLSPPPIDIKISPNSLGHGGVGEIFEVISSDSPWKGQVIKVFYSEIRQNPAQMDKILQNHRWINSLKPSKAPSPFWSPSYVGDVFLRGHTKITPIQKIPAVIFPKADGDLKKLLKNGRLVPQKATHAGEILPGLLILNHLASRLLEALAWLARENRIHGDIKPGNILFKIHKPSGSIEFFLADFDTLVDRGTPFMQPRETTSYPYASPEHLTGSPLFSESDLYSVALVLAHMGWGFLPSGTQNLNRFKDRFAHWSRRNEKAINDGSDKSHKVQFLVEKIRRLIEASLIESEVPEQSCSNRRSAIAHDFDLKKDQYAQEWIPQLFIQWKNWDPSHEDLKSQPPDCWKTLRDAA